MIWAYGDYAGTTIGGGDEGMSWHGKNGHSDPTWDLFLFSKGGAESLGDNGLTPTPTPPTPTPTPMLWTNTTQVLVLDNGSSLNIGYDTDT